MFCPACGNKIEEGAKFCEECGWKVEKPEELNPDKTAKTEDSGQKAKAQDISDKKTTEVKKPSEKKPGKSSQQSNQKQKNNLIPVIVGILAGAAVISAALILLFVYPGFLKKGNAEDTAQAPGQQTETAAVSENKSGEAEEADKTKTEEAEAEKPEEKELDRSEYIYFRPVIEETVIVNLDKVKITAKELHADGDSGDLYLDISIKNGTDKEITVLSGEGYINGMLADVALAASVEPGEMKDTRVTFMGYSLDISHIEKIGELELDFKVIDADTYEELFATEPVSIKTDLYGTFDLEYPDYGDENKLNIISDDDETVKGINTQFMWFYQKGELIDETAAAVFYIQNNTKNDYCFAGTDVLVNGEPATGFVENTLWAGHKGMFIFQIAGLDDNKEVDTVEITVNIYKGNDVSSGKNVGYFSLLYDPGMGDLSAIAEKFSTEDAPTDEEFVFFSNILEELENKKKINYDHPAYSGGYKAFMVIYDDKGETPIAVRYMTAEIKSLGEDITVTLHHISEYDCKTNKTKDISDWNDMVFTGKWNADDDFTARGDEGMVDMGIISTEDAQYALGSYMFPSGEEANLGFMRP